VNRLRVIAAVVALLAIAGLAVGTAPTTDDDVVAPFTVRGELGDTIETRVLTVSALEVTRASSLDVRYFEGLGSYPEQLDTDANWIVVTVRLTATIAPVSLNNARLRIGETEFRASEFLPRPSLDDFLAGPGIAVLGTVAFEVPDAALADAAADRAELSFPTQFSTQLDEIATVELDLSGLDSVADYRVAKAVIVNGDD
jgi:hypothetical protein